MSEVDGDSAGEIGPTDSDERADESTGEADEALGMTAAGGDAQDVLSVEALTKAVHASFSRARQARIPIGMVREVIETLALSTRGDEPVAPHLRLTRLRITGEKRLHHAAPEPIDRAWAFAPGVNVVLIADNSVGKSSIFKTIKFALTGDDSDYDADVRAWIRSVWLEFTLGDAPFTVHLSRGIANAGDGAVEETHHTGAPAPAVARADEGSVRGLSGYIASGHTFAAAGEVVAPAVVLKALRDAGAAREELQRFFLDALGLTTLGWTQDVNGTAEERRTSWQTFFQALVIPDSAEDYLLLDDAHNMGNQGGLILSVFLGLQLAEPLNQLLVDNKKAQAVSKVTAEQRGQAESELAVLVAAREELAQQVKAINDAVEARASAVAENPDARRYRELLMRQGEMEMDFMQLRGRLTTQTTHASRLRARVRSLTEAIALRRHFTGLDVALCPNCDVDVETEAVERERAEHVCRLCTKPVRPATGDDISAHEAEIDSLTSQAEEAATLRDSLSGQLSKLGGERTQLEAAVAEAAAVASQGPSFAAVTREEDAQRSELLQAMGELRGRIGMATALVERAQGGSEADQHRAAVREKVRTVLAGHARRLNEAALSRLGALVGETSARIGAESISEVTVSPLGVLTLQKHGARVTFKSIRNPGERLRVKLAFFLAMMQQGRMKDAGRHPGFLMIDQPGSDEMVPEDFEALARVLADVDRDLAHSVQIICFTARQEFEMATSAEKVYGATTAGFAF